MSAEQTSSEALEVLLRRHAMRLRAIIERHCRSSAALDPDDIAQEVRIRLWRALQRDRNAALTASYLQRTVMSAVIDAVRRAPPAAEWVGTGEDPGQSVLPEALVERDGPETHASRDALTQALESALADLPKQRSLAVRLSLQGFTAKECGVMVGVSDEAARKLAERGLVRVRELLREQGFGEFDD